MIGYQQTYSPAFSRARLSQPASVPPPAPDFLFTGYTGIPGFIEAVTVLTITGAAAWVGIRTGLDKKSDDYLKIAGWIGGVGSALMGLFYLGGKTGVNQMISLPAVRVSPT